MDFKEIDEELEAQFGKRTSQTIAESNIQFCLKLIESHMKNGKVDPDVEEPSIDATAKTILAVTKYPNKTFAELTRQQPVIRKSLLYCIVKGYDNYDEVHKHILSCLKKHANRELTIKCVQNFLNMIQVVGNMKPTKFIDCVNYPERYDEILKVLHHLIDNKGDKMAALVILSAQEDTILKPTNKRKAYTDEFNVNKSGFDKFMTEYMNMQRTPKDIQNIKEYIKWSLRNLLKYQMVDGAIQWKYGIKKRELFKMFLNFLKR